MIFTITLFAVAVIQVEGYALWLKYRQLCTEIDAAFGHADRVFKNPHTYRKFQSPKIKHGYN